MGSSESRNREGIADGHQSLAAKEDPDKCLFFCGDFVSEKDVVAEMDGQDI